MEKLDRAQFLKMTLLSLSVLFCTPFVYSWMKPPILFLLLNLLILAVGAESGAFSNFTKGADEEKPITTILVSHKEIKKHHAVVVVTNDSCSTDRGPVDCKLTEKQATAETVVKVVRVRSNVRKSPSTPSLFFIDDRIIRKEERHDETIDEAEELSAQELSTKAESFIRNFYKQLKMQREESWKRIHGLYDRPI